MKRNEAERFIAAVCAMREAASDRQALAAADAYPGWRSGKLYKQGDRVRYADTLYKCCQEHSALDDWTPNAVPALWVAISLEDGSRESPVTAERGMEYEEGKYYMDPENNKLYICTRSAVLQYMPHELVGHYFEEV